jgi:hypothetical protein
MPEKIASSSATPKSTPYGIGTVQPASMQMAGAQATAHEIEEPTYPVNNWVSWVTLFFGVAALAMTLENALPGSSSAWIEGAGVWAVLCGLFAILRRMRGRASNTWAPIVGIVFGLTATAVALLGVNVADLITTAMGGAPPASSATDSMDVALVRPVSSEPFVFASNAALTEDGTEVQQIATAINQNYASGNSVLATGQAWPQFLKFTSSQVLADSGTPLVTVRPGHVFRYTLAADLKSYTFTVSSGDLSDSAIYDSEADHFTYACPVSDTSCVPAH